MRYLLIALLLSGCSTVVPVKAKFPAASSEEALQKCPELQVIDPNTDKLTEVMKIVADNYKEYHLCRGKVDDWIDWYNKQKSNFGN